MKPFLLITYCLISFYFCVNAQTVMPNNLRAATTLDRLSTFSGNTTPDLLYGIPMPPGKVIGDTYLNAEWKTSAVQLYENDKTIEGFPARYDIAANELEFNSKNGIKVIDGGKVKSFVWVDNNTRNASYFINAKEFKTEDNVPLIGFFEVLADGKLPLLKRTKIVIKKADYNMALNAGSPDDKILKSTELYYSKDGILFEIKGSLKKTMAVFGSQADVVKKHVHESSSSKTKEEQLTEMFQYYNSL